MAQKLDSFINLPRLCNTGDSLLKKLMRIQDEIRKNEIGSGGSYED